MNEIESHHVTQAQQILKDLNWEDKITCEQYNLLIQSIADNDPYANEIEEEEEVEIKVETNPGNEAWSGLWTLLAIILLLGVSDKNNWLFTAIQVILAGVLVWARYHWDMKAKEEPPKGETLAPPDPEETP